MPGGPCYARVTIDAAEACRRHGWSRGTVITSTKWRSPRRIFRIDDIDGVYLAVPSNGPACRKVSYQWRKTFPADVRQVERGDMRRTG